MYKQPPDVQLYQRGKTSNVLFLVEGEKDVNSCSEKLGLFSFSPLNGANLPSKPEELRKEIELYTKIASGRDVIILQDNDRKGKSFAQKIAAILYECAKSVKVIDLTEGFQQIGEKGDISDAIECYGADEAKQILTNIITKTPEWSPISEPHYSKGRKGSEYSGDLVIDYLWEPYFPKDEYSDVFGKSGSGKTFFVALVCASTTTGIFPTETKDPGTVLYISGEETFEEIADRISRAGGDLEKVTIIDRSESVGMDFDERFEEFSAIVKSYSPDLLVCDPWQCFCGERIDLNRQNMTRPLLQKVSLLAKEVHCAIVFIAHMNKAQFTADANDGLSGSSEIINAARSGIRVIEDEIDQDCRIAVHTKSNHRKRGESLKYRFVGNRVVWDGFSEITKETLEKASRNRRTPFEVLQLSANAEEEHRGLIAALLEESRNTEKCGIRITYEEFRMKYGDQIFGGRQPKRVLSEMVSEMQARDILLKVDLDIRRGTKHFRGFYIQKLPDTDIEEI